MDVPSALRRIKRQFGDEYNVVITEQDIFDWIYDAELDIIRSINENDLTLQVASNKFPVSVPDTVNIKRLSVDGKALTYTSAAELDLNKASLTGTGGFRYWYRYNGFLNLWPLPDANVSTVEINYSKTPVPMYVVAEYLTYNNQTNALQVATVANDVDWQKIQGVNVEMELSIDYIGNGKTLMACHNNSTVAANLHFVINLGSSISPTVLSMDVSDGTTIRVFTVPFLTSIKADERFRFRFFYDPATYTASLYRIDLVSGVETLQGVSAPAPAAFVKQITAPALVYIGNIDGTTVNAYPYGMKIYGAIIYGSYNKNNPSFIFNGDPDLTSIYAPGATSFVTTSRHNVTLTPGLTSAALNYFTVPEVYHEDVVKYCLARAHTKNQNFRAAEAEMEQYDRRVSTRRNEAQAPETALYKIPDPADYEDYAY